MADILPIYPKHRLILEDIFSYAKLSIRDILGIGMSGDVVLAQSKNVPDIFMAVKSFTDSRTTGYQKEFFFREAWAMQRLNHPHLLKGIHAVMSPIDFYISMEYFCYGSLDTKLTKLTYAQIERYLVQLASAVKYMHDAGIVHCDIKLPNILVRSAETVVLADFGLCKLLPKDKKIALMKIGGTPAYIGPERRINPLDFKIDATKNDVYALGVVLWGLVYRINPERMNFKYLEITKNCPHIPGLLKFCLLNMLADDPEVRFSSSELFETLKNHSQWKKLAGELPVFQPPTVIQQNDDPSALSPLEVINRYIEQNRKKKNVIGQN